MDAATLGRVEHGDAGADGTVENRTEARIPLACVAPAAVRPGFRNTMLPGESPRAAGPARAGPSMSNE